MRRSVIAAVRGTAIAAALVSAAAGRASAQPSRTFVASTGSDANAGAGCPRTAPCRGFQAAIGAVAAGGEVVALDSAGYGPMTIDRPVTVTSEGAHVAISLGSAAAAVSVAPSVGPVTLRRLRLSGTGGGIGLDAGDGVLYVEDLVVSGFDTGLRLDGSQAFVKDTVVRDNAIGIRLGGAGTATLDAVEIENGGTALLVSQESRATLRDSAISGHTTAISASSLGDGGSSPILVDVEGCLLTQNGVAIDALGLAVVRVSDSRLVENGQGVSYDLGAEVRSFHDNERAGNFFTGTFTPPVIPHQ